jgi:arylsulfatase A-like enzyme
MPTTGTERPRVAMILLALALLALVAGVILWRAPWKDSDGAPRRNIILILLDTVRVDRLGCYGSAMGLTPEIDRFAETAVRFEQAFAHAPWTLPSVASLYTSRHPMQHGAGGHLGSFRMLPERAVTLAEVLRRQGLSTGAILNVLFLSEKLGMTQGFASVDHSVHADDNVSGRRAGPTTDAALGYIDSQGDQPFFLLVHYFDAHLTYDPPQPYRRRHADPQDREGTDYLFGTVRDMLHFRRGEIQLGDAMLGRLEKLYDGEIAYLDHEVGRLLDGLANRGLEGNTVVVITADHGEEFLDHDGFEHGHTLYDELLHVPLLIRTPEMTTARSVSAIVRQIDLAPTLCELAGVSSDTSFDGESLAGLMAGARAPERSVLSQGNMWGPSGAAWRAAGYKMIREAGSMSAELYDITADPGEQMNVCGEVPERCATMVQDLNLVLKRLATEAAPGESPTLSERDIQRLRALGYLK